MMRPAVMGPAYARAPPGTPRLGAAGEFPII